MTDIDKRIDEIMEKTAQAKEQPLTKMLLDASIKFNCRPSDLCINQQNCGDTIKFWIGRIPENIVDERSVLIQELQAQVVERVSVEEIAEVLRNPVYCRPSCLSDAETLLADAAEAIHKLIYKTAINKAGE